MKLTAIVIGLALILDSARASEELTANNTLDSYHHALEIIQGALVRHGGLEAIQNSGVTIELQGTFDLSARFQGRRLAQPEKTPIKERIVIDLKGNRLSYDVDWFNYYSSNQKLREIYDAEGRLLFMDHLAKAGGYLPRQTVPDAQARTKRIFPNLLLADALSNRVSLHSLPDMAIGDKRFDQVGFVTQAGDRLTLLIDQQSQMLWRAASVIDMPILGDAQVQWQWDGYDAVGKLQIPKRFTVTLADRIMKTADVSVTLDTDPSSFSIPDDYAVGPPPETLSPLSGFIPYGQREPVVEAIAPQVYRVQNLRPGFGMLFVEFADFVLAVDAPSGWYEMQQIPPMNWSYGDGTSSLGHKYIRGIESTVPDKPIRYLALTHHHSDHIGGLLPFLAKEVEVLAGKGAAAATRQAASATFTRDTDAPSTENLRPTITVVDGMQQIKDDTMTVQLIELPADNPKAENYLMVYLPRQKILYATAFIYPVPEDAFPPTESIPLSIYFVEWLDQSELDVERIYNIHGDGLVEEWQLEKIRELSNKH